MLRKEAIEKWVIPALKNTWNEKRCNEVLEVLEQDLCDDCISRSSIKQKLQEHHDFFVKAYGGFSNLPQNDKSRVDEITNCIAMVVNEPSVTPAEKVGHWITLDNWLDVGKRAKCSECGQVFVTGDDVSRNYCPNCGSFNGGEQDGSISGTENP